MSELKDQRPDLPPPPDPPEVQRSKSDASSEQVSGSAEGVRPATNAESDENEREAASGEGEVERPTDGAEQGEALVAKFDREAPAEAQSATVHGEVQDEGATVVQPDSREGSTSSEKAAEAVTTTAELALEAQGAGQGEALMQDDRPSREEHTPGGLVEAQGDGASGAVQTGRRDGSERFEPEPEVTRARAELEGPTDAADQAEEVTGLDNEHRPEEQSQRAHTQDDGAAGAEPTESGQALELPERGAEAAGVESGSHAPRLSEASAKRNSEALPEERGETPDARAQDDGPPSNALPDKEGGSEFSESRIDPARPEIEVEGSSDDADRAGAMAKLYDEPLPQEQRASGMEAQGDEASVSELPGSGDTSQLPEKGSEVSSATAEGKPVTDNAHRAAAVAKIGQESLPEEQSPSAKDHELGRDIVSGAVPVDDPDNADASRKTLDRPGEHMGDARAKPDETGESEPQEAEEPRKRSGPDNTEDSRERGGAAVLETPGEAAEFIGREAEGWAESLTEEERAAVQDYADEGHRVINNDLRRGVEGSDRIQALDTAIEKGSLSKGVMLHRGVDNETLYKNVEGLVGQRFEDPAFLSTSADTSVGTTFADGQWPVVFEIETDPGTHAAFPDAVGTKYRESEILLGRNTGLEILDVEQHGAVKHVHAQVVK